MGVTVEVITPGDGIHFPKQGDRVTIHSVGILEYNNQVFDDSHNREPLQFTIGSRDTIRGLEEGVPKLSLGEKAKLYISGDYAFGGRGYPGLIPPNSPLIFEVELLRIN